jgi:hypothetical protein
MMHVRLYGMRCQGDLHGMISTACSAESALLMLPSRFNTIALQITSIPLRRTHPMLCAGIPKRM